MKLWLTETLSFMLRHPFHNVCNLRSVSLKKHMLHKRPPIHIFYVYMSLSKCLFQKNVETSSTIAVSPLAICDAANSSAGNVWGDDNHYPASGISCINKQLLPLLQVEYIYWWHSNLPTYTNLFEHFSVPFTKMKKQKIILQTTKKKYRHSTRHLQSYVFFLFVFAHYFKTWS